MTVMDKKKHIKIVKRLSLLGFMLSVGDFFNHETLLGHIFDAVCIVGNFTFFVMAIWEETNEFRR